MKNGRTRTDNCRGAIDSNDFHSQLFARFPSFLDFCADLLAKKTHFLLLEDREAQISSVQQDLGGCLLVVGLRGEFSCQFLDFFILKVLLGLRGCKAVLHSGKLGPRDLLVFVWPTP